LKKAKKLTPCGCFIFKADAKNALAHFLAIFYIIFKNVDFLRVKNQLDFID
jgi:hypothetical protein